MKVLPVEKKSPLLNDAKPLSISSEQCSAFTGHKDEGTHACVCACIYARLFLPALHSLLFACFHTNTFVQDRLQVLLGGPAMTGTLIPTAGEGLNLQCKI